MQKKFLLLLILLSVFIQKGVFAQSEWQGIWANYDTHNHTWIMQVIVKNDSIFGIKYSNEDWTFYTIAFKGELSKKGNKVSGTYRYTDNSESGKFELKMDKFSKKAPQFTEGIELFFEGELGINKYNTRNWNGSKRSSDTSLTPMKEFVETYKKERPKKFTSEEMITLVKNADFLNKYRSFPEDAEAPVLQTNELLSTCREGVFTVSGLNRYIIADYCFFKENGLSRCAIYINVADKIVEGALVGSKKNAAGDEEREYKLYGATIDDAIITRMTVTGRKVFIYFSNYNSKGKLNCSLEN